MKRVSYKNFEAAVHLRVMRGSLTVALFLPGGILDSVKCICLFHNI